MAALGFAGCSMPSHDLALHALRSWLDSWAGIGRLAAHTRADSRAWRFVLVAAALFDTVALAGCAAEPRILSYYHDWRGVRGGTRPAPHEGVDFAASMDDPVIAPTDGRVVRVFADGSCGHGIVVQHPVDEAAWRTRYCHLNGTNVQQGQRVTRGDVLGAVGTTGNSMGVPHLHFELWQRHPRDGSFGRIDPLPFIVGCFDSAKTVAYSALPDSGERPRLVLTYPVRCAGSIK